MSSKKRDPFFWSYKALHEAAVPGLPGRQRLQKLGKPCFLLQAHLGGVWTPLPGQLWQREQENVLEVISNVHTLMGGGRVDEAELRANRQNLRISSVLVEGPRY